MSAPAPAEVRASRRGGIKVAVLAALGLVLMAAAWLDRHDGIAVLFAAVTIGGCWLEGLPKAARARRRYRR
jgi:hypothetical protein